MATRGATVKLQYCATLGGTYLDLAGLKDFTPASEKIDDIEVTSHDSPAATGGGVVKEFMSGNEDPGELSLELYWTKALNTTLLALKGVTKYWKATYPDGGTPGSTDVGQGYINDLGKKSESAGVISQTVKIKLSGAQVFTPST